jgi:hypothetical protein
MSVAWGKQSNDTWHFNRAMMAYAQRHSTDVRFCDMTIEQQREVLSLAQTLKDADDDRQADHEQRRNESGHAD